MWSCESVIHSALVSRYLPADVPAQIAVISDRLASVLGHSGDENEAATLNSPIQVDISSPRLERGHQGVSTSWDWAG